MAVLLCAQTKLRELLHERNVTLLHSNTLGSPRHDWKREIMRRIRNFVLISSDAISRLPTQIISENGTISVVSTRP